jgi:putative exporter of polyketide antibiotics
VDGQTGYLVPPRDPDALADRLARLFRKPDLLRLFGRQAARRAGTLFTWEIVARAVGDVYGDVIEARTGRLGRLWAHAPALPTAEGALRLAMIPGEVESR